MNIVEIKLNIFSDLENRDGQYYFENKEVTVYMFKRLIAEVTLSRITETKLINGNLVVALSKEAQAKLRQLLYVGN